MVESNKNKYNSVADRQWMMMHEVMSDSYMDFMAEINDGCDNIALLFLNHYIVSYLEKENDGTYIIETTSSWYINVCKNWKKYVSDKPILKNIVFHMDVLTNSKFYNTWIQKGNNYIVTLKK